MPTINGTAGNDTLVGTDQDDIVRAGAGNDVIDGRLGADLLYGEDGDDTFIFSVVRASNQPFPLGLIDGGMGFDTLEVSGVTPVTFQRGDSPATGFRITVGTQVFDVTGIEQIITGGGADILDFQAHQLGLTIRAGAGSDTVLTGSGVDVVFGEGGNDTISAAAVDVDTFYGGDGNDVLRGGALMFGDAGNDSIEGSTRATMFGGAGDDTLRLSFLQGFLSDDARGAIDGGDGRDTLIVGDFRPFRGTLEFFSVDLQTGLVTITTSETSSVGTRRVTNTVTVSGIEDAQVSGGTLLGNAGANVLRGGTDMDGRGGDDWLIGTAGNDILRGGSGGDLLEPGVGQDTVDGGEGVDTVSYQGLTQGVTVSLVVGTTSVAPNGFLELKDRLTSIENVTGTSLADFITGDAGANRIDGGDGADRLYGGAGNDVINGGAGDDIIYGDDGDDIISAGMGVDTVYGGSGNDSIYGSAFGSLYGEAGNDIFYADMGSRPLAGPILMDGGAGDDLFIVSSPFNVMTLVGGEGNDTFRIGDRFEAGRISTGAGSDLIEFGRLYPGTDVDFVVSDFTNGAGGDRIALSQYLLAAGTGWDGESNPFQLGILSILQSGADVIIASGGRLRITLQNVTVESLTPFNLDSFVPATLGQVLTIVGGGGDDLIYGGSAADVLSGGAGNDRITGGAGNDLISGDDGDDTLMGGAGDDRMIGGRGSDRLDGGVGLDTAVFSGMRSAVTVSSSTGVLTVTGAEGTDTLSNIEALQFEDGIYDLVAGRLGAQARQTLTGTSGNDVLNGGDSNDTISGLDGDDILRGGNGSDLLNGGSGFDAALYGGVVRQYAASGAAGTTLTGGPEGGTDTLVSIEEARFVDGLLTFHVDSASAQVMRLYDAALDRLPDQGGLQSHASNLARGAFSLSTLAQSFVASPEFQTRYGLLSNQAFVEQLYRFALDRVGDPQGVQAWVSNLNNGMTRGDVLIAFSESAEHRTLTSMVLARGLWVPDAQATTIARLYDAAFDRLPDVGGLAAWTGNLRAGLGLSDIAAAFANSAEFQARYGSLTNQAFVEQLYRFCLDRNGDPGGVQGWVRNLDNGLSRGEVLRFFSESAEHIALTDPLWLGGVRFEGYSEPALTEAAAGKGLHDVQVMPLIPADAEAPAIEAVQEPVLREAADVPGMILLPREATTLAWGVETAWTFPEFGDALTDNNRAGGPLGDPMDLMVVPYAGGDLPSPFMSFTDPNDIASLLVGGQLGDGWLY